MLFKQQTILFKSLTIYDTKQMMFCLSFPLRDRATSPGQYEYRRQNYAIRSARPGGRDGLLLDVEAVKVSAVFIIGPRSNYRIKYWEQLMSVLLDSELKCCYFASLVELNQLCLHYPSIVSSIPSLTIYCSPWQGSSIVSRCRCLYQIIILRVHF